MSTSLDPLDERQLILTGLLGAGRHGRVFLGRTPQRSDPLAVKVPVEADVARRELDALRRFRHPHLVAMVAPPLPNGSLVLEHCAGGTLAHRLSSLGWLSPREAVAVSGQILDALEHVHAHGWIHGDVSPSNIAFRTDGTAVLIDLATMRPGDSGPISECTTAFAGPLRSAEPRIDLRALAATVVHSLGDQDRWNAEATRLRDRLAAFLDAADGDGAATAADLRTALAGVPPQAPAVATEPRPGRGGTVRFGPRPSPEPPPSSAGARRTPVLIAAIVLGGLLLFASEVAIGTSGRSPEPVPLDSLEFGSDTLTAFDLEWDPRSGVLRRRTDAQSWHVGAAGDQVAVADWDCDGRPTLGVYRPGTGAWFEFDDWASGARSRRPDPLDADGLLAVATDERGCASPVVSW